MKFSEIRPKIKNLGNFKSLAEIKRAGLRVVRNTKSGDYWLIEKEFLKPVIKSPRESGTILVKPEKLRYKVFMCHKTKPHLEGTMAHEYIKWGKKQKYHQRETCKSRSIWWNLGERNSWTVLWPMIHNNRLAIFRNEARVCVDHNLFEVRLKNAKREPLTLFCMLETIFRELYGRWNLGQGALKTEGVDIAIIEFLDPNFLSDEQYSNLSRSVKELARRNIQTVFEECGIDSSKPLRLQEPNPLSDRKTLDDIVFDALGLTEEERKEVYWAVCELVQKRLQKAKSV